jgi:hypothetical protein
VVDCANIIRGVRLLIVRGAAHKIGPQVHVLPRKLAQALCEKLDLLPPILT